MNWLLRFALGLPARPTDIADLQRDVPELLDEGWPRNADWHPLWSRPVWIRFVWMRPDEAQEFAARLRAWVRKALRHETVEPHALGAVESCDRPDCPKRSVSAAEAPRTHTSEPATAETGGPDIIGRCELMRLGGGPRQKNEKKDIRSRFFDLVRQVHAGAGEAKKVVVTDPYLLTDTGERGTPGGFENFCEYLRTIRLASDAVLFITPAPKKPSDNRDCWIGFDRRRVSAGSCAKKRPANRDRWIERVQKEFPGLTVTSFTPRLSFHDRFYLVEHVTGVVRGVFGPSMNALSNTDIVLFGELEIKNALNTLSDWFDLKSPSSNR